MAKRFPQSNFVQGGIYHIYNRGIRKQTIFHDNRDYKRYLDRMREYKTKHNISILAYCLMPNHVHLMIRQNDPNPLSLFIQRLHTAYSMYYNVKYKQVGHLFQNRSYAKLIDHDEYLMHLSRYIHLNPRKLVRKLPGYKWSSYPTYLQQKPTDDLVDTKFVLSMFKRKNESLESTILTYVEFTRAQMENDDLTTKISFKEDLH